MERWLGSYSEWSYGLLRIVAGLFFACHGAQKLFGMFGGSGAQGNPLMLTAGIIEFFGGLLIALGLWTGIAAFVSSGQMAVAYFMMHAPGGFWPIQNQGELAALYCFAFLYIACKGTGRLGIDAIFSKPRAMRGV